MLYFLWKAAMWQSPKIPITKDQHDTIISAWRAIVTVLDIEEEWDSLIQNYIELEMELLKSAMDTMVLNHESYGDMQQRRLIFSRRLSNLLQTCRSYIDRTPHHLKKLEGHDFEATFDELRRAAHAAHFGYRFMDAMRNYAQHRGVPLHGATYHAGWIGDDNGNRKAAMRHVVTANVNLNKVRSDKKFSAKVRAEVAGVDRLDIAALTREYIEALGTVHIELRARMAEALAKWKATVKSAIEQYAVANNDNVIGLCVAEFADERNLIAKVDIFDDLLLRQEQLVQRNGSLVNFRRRYVSNEIMPAKNRR